MTTTLHRGARPITDEEAAVVEAVGWGHLPGFLDPGTLSVLRTRADTLLGLDPAGAMVRPGPAVHRPTESARRAPRHVSKVFSDVALDAAVGESAGRVINREDSIVLVDDEVGQTRDQAAADPAFHQGASCYQLDTTFAFTWIALTDIDAEQGAPVFVDGSHRLGLLGLGFYTAETMQGWARLAPGSVSAPQVLKAGDAVVARSETIRAFPPNTTDRAALTYTLVHAPATTTYIGWPVERPDGTELTSHQLLTEAGHPVTYRGLDRADWRRTQGAKG